MLWFWCSWLFFCLHPKFIEILYWRHGHNKTTGNWQTTWKSHWACAACLLGAALLLGSEEKTIVKDSQVQFGLRLFDVATAPMPNAASECLRPRSSTEQSSMHRCGRDLHKKPRSPEATSKQKLRSTRSRWSIVSMCNISSAHVVTSPDEIPTARAPFPQCFTVHVTVWPASHPICTWNFYKTKRNQSLQSVAFKTPICLSAHHKHDKLHSRHSRRIETNICSKGVPKANCLTQNRMPKASSADVRYSMLSLVSRSSSFGDFVNFLFNSLGKYSEVLVRI